ISQRRLMAMRASKLDAYRNLIEQVYGQNINSTTTVEDMVVSSDTLRAHVQGLIYGAHLVSISPVGDDSYETKLELTSTIVNDLRSMLNNS
ncbi:MAG: LPP20 family lipoprotein, partial [Methylococcaceae bacterium]|nr:LPP20 family lipoprotein [Methylococcaceae bacterium]